MEILTTNNQGKVQEEEVFLYKLYKIDTSKPKTLQPVFIQEEINNLKKYMKFIQAPVKMIPLYPPPHYKSL